jgi:hypothetical protein
VAVRTPVSTATVTNPTLTFPRTVAASVSRATAATPAPVVFEGQAADVLHTVRLDGDFTVQQPLDGEFVVQQSLDGEFVVQQSLDGEID